jgi:hypothetical protein
VGYVDPALYAPEASVPEESDTVVPEAVAWPLKTFALASWRGTREKNCELPELPVPLIVVEVKPTTGVLTVCPNVVLVFPKQASAKGRLSFIKLFLFIFIFL